jgi:hypothetical protein
MWRKMCRKEHAAKRATIAAFRGFPQGFGSRLAKGRRERNSFPLRGKSYLIWKIGA